MDKNIRFLDYVTLLVVWKKRIIVNLIIICIISALISLMLPKWYKSFSTILPPVDESTDFGLGGIVKNLSVGNLGMGLGSISEESSRFIAIVNSRTMLEKVIKQFNLQEIYKKRNLEETIKELRKHISLDLHDDGSITIYAEAKTHWLSFGENDTTAKKLSRNMANFVISEYDKLNKEFKIEKAHSVRLFIEKRYEQNLKDLFSAEENYKTFQQKYGTIAVPEQTAATINAIAELKAQIIVKEVELGTLKKSVAVTNSEYSKTYQEWRSLSQKYSEMVKKQNMTSNDDKKEWGSIFLPLKDIPDLNTEYLRRYREVIIQNKLLEFLLPQYENAKIQELKDTPTIQILDRAFLPEKKARPKRILIVFIAGFFSIFCFIMAAYISVNLGYIKKSDPERYQRILWLLSELHFRGWLK